MSRPCRRNKKPQDLDQVFYLSRRNYKVNIDFRPDPQRLRCLLAILGTGAGRTFIGQSKLPEGVAALIKYGPIPEVCEANGKPLSTLGSVKMCIRLGRFFSMIKFIACERLAAPAILGTDYCDRFIESITPRTKCVELSDGSKIPIVRRPLRFQAQALPPKAW